MTQRSHKIINGVFNFIAIGGSLEGLAAILNLNQLEIYLRTAFIVGLFYIAEVVFLYDLHYKTPGSLSRAKQKQAGLAFGWKIFSAAFWDRCQHLRRWQFFRQWLNYLILPGLIFWGTISVFYLNLGDIRMQQIFITLSSVALYFNYWYLKEIFSRGKEEVDHDIFIVLSVVKIYASALIFGVIIGLTKNYCLDARLTFLAAFCCTFLLVYQALFQHRLISLKNLSITLGMCLAMGILSWGVLAFWNYNYYTAAIFLATCYNLMWAVFHHRLDHALTWAVFWEIVIVSAIIGGMVLSVTNFRAKISDDCAYTLGGRY